MSSKLASHAALCYNERTNIVVPCGVDTIARRVTNLLRRLATMDNVPSQSAHRKFLAQIPETHKWCPRCKLLLEKSCFNRNKAQPDGLAPHCRDCRKALRLTNLEQHQAYNRAR